MRINGIRYHTWEDWKYQGFKVIRGEHAYYRNAYGTPVFSRDQVTKRPFGQRVIVRYEYY